MHIKNIYIEGELQPEATVKKYERINLHKQAHRFGSNLFSRLESERFNENSHIITST